MENSAPSNVWTHSTRWHRYFASRIETNDLKFISSLYFISFYSLVYNYLTTWLSISKTKILLFIIFPHPPPTNDFGIWFSRAHISFCALIKLRSSRFQHLWHSLGPYPESQAKTIWIIWKRTTVITTIFFLGNLGKNVIRDRTLILQQSTCW